MNPDITAMLGAQRHRDLLAEAERERRVRLARKGRTTDRSAALSGLARRLHLLPSPRPTQAVCESC